MNKSKKRERERERERERQIERGIENSLSLELGHESPALGLGLTPLALQFSGFQTWTRT